MPAPVRHTVASQGGPSAWQGGSQPLDFDEVEDDEANSTGDVVEPTAEQLVQHYNTVLRALETQYGEAFCSAPEASKIASIVFRHMLFKNGSEPGVPVKRDELIGCLPPEYKGRHQFSSYIIAKVQLMFAEIYGYEMRELVRSAKGGHNARKSSSQAAPAAAGGGTKCYVLRSLLPADVRRDFLETDDELAIKGLATVVVALIYLEGGSMAEGALWDYLGHLGLKKDQKGHQHLGDAETAMETLMKRRYVQRVKGTDSQGAQEFLIELAENALDEVGKAKITSYIQSMVNEPRH
eukprot:TRINITY_DN38340_c0_g1_i1.p1 TRINITY_DN38340_c0_g1~~TRINITY_DN38340_c0_g1_i1.p1  ORF type:complete len:294 (+),score=58.93 TRINITY_DN38340_c0_g1_i1:406-1287(+)